MRDEAQARISDFYETRSLFHAKRTFYGAVMMEAPENSLFIITGTTRGIGAALVESALAQPHSTVVGLSRKKSHYGKNHQNIQIDLNDLDEIGSAFQRIHVDRRHAQALTSTVLVNNAGVLDPIGPVMDCDDSMISQNIRVNLTAPLIVCRHFYHFAKGFSGHKWIINITSGASRSPYYGWSAYGAAKAGLDMATRAVAMEFSRIDPSFSAIAVAPGTVDTAMQEKIRQCNRKQFDRIDKFMRLKEDGQLSSPRQVADALIHLLLAGRFENGGRYDIREMRKEDIALSREQSAGQ